MTRRENRDYGKIIDYDPQWKGPLQIEREQTDFGFLISLGVYLAVWISTGIYAFCTGEIKNGGGNQRGASYRLVIDNILSPSTHSNIISIALGFIILGIFLSFAYFFLLRHYPKAVVFTGIFVTLVLLVVFIGAFAYVMANGTPQDNGNAIIGLVVCVVLFIVMVICVIVYRKKIIIACGVVKESTKAVIFFPSSFVFPILPIILYGITLVFAGYTFTYLSVNPSMRSSNTPIHIYLFHGINFFGMLWMLNFIYAFSQMVLSGTFATWYWTMDKERVPSLAILKFMHVTTRFHLGTLAFGSLIIAVVEAIKALLRSLTQRSQDSGNDMAALCFRCFGCICGAVENFLEYINSNAYIMCTIHGTKFIQSAKDAFNLLMRNAMNVVAVTNVTGAILLLGELVVVGLSVLATYLYCQNMDDNIKYTVVGIVFISTLLMSVSIFEVLKTAINTIFLCVLEDYERNDGSSERPYFMPYKLRQLLIQDA